MRGIPQGPTAHLHYHERRKSNEIVLIGGTGNMGSRVVTELISRNHTVTAVVWRPKEVPAHPTVMVKRSDVSDERDLLALLAGHDAIVSSLRLSEIDPPKLIDSVRTSGVRRYVVVGGAGSLEVSPGVRLIDTERISKQVRPEAAAGVAFLNLLDEEEQLNRTFISPSVMFVPDERTGKFRIGDDSLLTGPEGSRISFEDFALALVDELETTSHRQRRFRLGTNAAAQGMMISK
ncbi:MAG: NAD(P)-dependent oxidoreductase [Acidimicrobiales bacterium]